MIDNGWMICFNNPLRCDELLLKIKIFSINIIERIIGNKRRIRVEDWICFININRIKWNIHCTPADKCNIEKDAPKTNCSGSGIIFFVLESRIFIQLLKLHFHYSESTWAPQRKALLVKKVLTFSKVEPKVLEEANKCQTRGQLKSPLIFKPRKRQSVQQWKISEQIGWNSHTISLCVLLPTQCLGRSTHLEENNIFQL